MKKTSKPKPPTAEQIFEAQMGLSNEYLSGILFLTACAQPDLNELNYVKVAVETPNGGKYLLALLHVDGPKIQLDEIRGSKSK